MCLSPELYEWEENDVKWLWNTLTSDGEMFSLMFVEIIEFCEELDFNYECPNIATLMDDINWGEVCDVEV